MNRLTDGHFVFVATTPVPAFRLKLGYHDMNKEYPYVLTTYDSEENARRARRLAVESDVIIFGSAPEKYILDRIKCKKLTFRYSERINKNGIRADVSLRSLGSIVKHHTRYLFSPVYMLCSSCFTAVDFALAGAYIGKTYKWGYFPETYHYDINHLLELKKGCQPVSILWVGRLIELKHAEHAIMAAQRLHLAGYAFELSFIGEGPLASSLQQQVNDSDLQDKVHFLGSMPPEDVREKMEKASIFLFTSDRHEGWGAVLNESMNSACAVVASDAIGSVGFMMKDKENGLIYHNGNVEDLYTKIRFLMDHPSDRDRMARNAYMTIENEWNAETAAERFIALAGAFMQNKKGDLFAEGPCSRAKIIRESRCLEK